MARGYYLLVGDKTTCKGEIITGCENHIIHGKATARSGDKYICGKDRKIYHIAGGIPNYILHGVPAAGTLNSKGTCSCRCDFIPSNWDDTYEFESESKKQVVRSTPAPAPASAPAAIKPVAPVVPEQPREPVDAGFCILPYGAVTEAYEGWLFQQEPPAGTRELYRSLNGSRNEYKAGSIMLLVDPDKQDSAQIAHMKAAKQRIDAALEPLSHRQANFLFKHKDTVEMFAAAASTASSAASYSGQATEAAKGYFDRIENILIQIQDAYKNQYLTRGTLIGEQFFVERQRLFGQLDSVLKMFMKHRFMFNEYTDLKSALGLSSSSITHRWDETGISDIEGYATHIEKLAKYVKLMETAGKIGLGLSAFDTAAKITEACSVGRDCAKTTFTSIGEFSGSLAGGALAGRILQGSAANTICAVVLGAATVEAGGAGALLCTIGVSGGIAYGSDKALSAAGEFLGEVFYKATNND